MENENVNGSVSEEEVASETIQQDEVQEVQNESNLQQDENDAQQEVNFVLETAAVVVDEGAKKSAKDSQHKITSEQVANVSKEQFNKSKVMFLEFIKKPVTMMSGLKDNDDMLTPLLFGALQVILTLIFTSIKLKSFSSGLLIALAVIVANVVSAGIVFAVGKSKDSSLNFMKILELFCIATIPGTALLIVAFIFSFFWLGGTALFLCVGFLSWIMLGYHAANEYIQMDKNLVFWIYLVIIAAVVIVVSIISKQVIKIWMQGYLKSLFSFSSIFS